jgi:hypothetical protein
VNNLSLGFKSIVEKLQVAYRTLLKKYELLKKENTELKKRAEKAEKDLASKPIEEIMAGRKQAVPVTHNQQKDMRRR